MWFVGIGAAWAGTAVEDVTAAMRQHPGTTVMSCAPVSALVPLLPAIPTSALAGTGPLADLAAPGALETLGVDPSGAFTLAVDSAGKTSTWSVSFRGSRDQAQALLSRFHPALDGEATGWTWAGPDGARVHAALVEGTLTVGAVTAHPEKAGDASFLAGMPTAPGCAAWIHESLPATPATGTGSVTASLFLPLAGGAPMVMRIAGDKAPGAELLGAFPPPPAVATERPPTAVLFSSIPLDTLLHADPKGAALFPGGAEQLDAVRFPSGLSVAMWGNPKMGGSWAAVVDIRDKKGHKLPRARAVKALVNAGSVPVIDTKKGTFTGTLLGRTVMGAFTKDGRLVLASDEATREDVVADEGTAWLTPAVAERLQAWPLTVSTVDGGGPMSAWMGLRPQPTYWEISTEVHSPGMSLASMAPMLGMLTNASFGQILQKRDALTAPAAEPVPPAPAPPAP